MKMFVRTAAIQAWLGWSLQLNSVWLIHVIACEMVDAVSMHYILTLLTRVKLSTCSLQFTKFTNAFARSSKNPGECLCRKSVLKLIWTKSRWGWGSFMSASICGTENYFSYCWSKWSRMDWAWKLKWMAISYDANILYLNINSIASTSTWRLAR